MKKIFYILIILFILYSTSTDYPQTQWQLLGLNNEDVTKIVIHPNESKTLFAGSRSDFSLGSVGALFKSTNSGITWDTLISVITVRDIVINPVNPDIIYIAAEQMQATIRVLLKLLTVAILGLMQIQVLL